MAVPNTYLRTAPGDVEQTFGRGIESSTLIAGLQKINPRIRVPMPEHFDAWYPSQKEGVTCLWLGEVGAGRKICALRLGLIPEWTQLDSDGRWMIRGWRSVFDRVIRARAATARQIERQFNVVLETDGTDGSCVDCRREGRVRAAESKRGQRCGAHQEVVDISASARKEITECLST